MKKRLLIVSLFRSLLSVVVAIGTVAVASAQLLYEETFPFVAGDSSAFNNVGWTVITPPSGYNGNFAYDITNAATGQPISGNPVYMGSGSIGAGMFYTTNGAGTGPNGTSEFTSIDPSANPGLTFSIYANLQGTGGSSTYFAVEVGGAWYASSTAMAPPTSTDHYYDLRTLSYDAGAASWNTLAVTDTSVTIGGVASGDLAGPITGVGIVQSVPGSFNAWNFADYAVTIVPEPTSVALLSIGALFLVAFGRFRPASRS